MGEERLSPMGMVIFYSSVVRHSKIAMSIFVYNRVPLRYGSEYIGLPSARGLAHGIRFYRPHSGVTA
jgi:hypothetical protein